jgi:cytochrome bd ubiquinol oxidase subunit II
VIDLPTIWFGLFGVLLTGYAVLDGFDLGAGVLSLRARDDAEHRWFMNAVGPVWDGNEVWLLTGGGALFAAFPPVYASVFSGFYLAFVLLLLALIARAVSFEFRSKLPGPAWRRAWDLAFGLGSLVIALLCGVAVGNVMEGVPLDARGDYTGTFLALLNPFALVMGALSLVMFVAHGAAWVTLKAEGDFRRRMKRTAWRSWAAWLVVFVVASLAARWAAPGRFEGVAGRPLVWMSFALVVCGLFGMALALKKDLFTWAFLSSSTGVAGSVLLLGTSLYPHLLPSSGDPALGLTIYNSSSTHYTLGVMLVVAVLGMPLVIAYTAWIYRVFKGRVQVGEHFY